jgi:hypothetical protein
VRSLLLQCMSPLVAQSGGNSPHRFLVRYQTITDVVVEKFLLWGAQHKDALICSVRPDALANPSHTPGMVV